MITKGVVEIRIAKVKLKLKKLNIYRGYQNIVYGLEIAE